MLYADIQHRRQTGRQPKHRLCMEGWWEMDWDCWCCVFELQTMCCRPAKILYKATDECFYTFHTIYHKSFFKLLLLSGPKNVAAFLDVWMFFFPSLIQPLMSLYFTAAWHPTVQRHETCFSNLIHNGNRVWALFEVIFLLHSDRFIWKSARIPRTHSVRSLVLSDWKQLISSQASVFQAVWLSYKLSLIAHILD